MFLWASVELARVARVMIALVGDGCYMGARFAVGMAETVDAADLKSAVRKDMRVRLPLPAFDDERRGGELGSPPFIFGVLGGILGWDGGCVGEGCVLRTRPRRGE